MGRPLCKGEPFRFSRLWRHAAIDRLADRVPVRLDMDLVGGEVVLQPASGRQLSNIAEDRLGMRNIQVGEVVPHRLPIDLTSAEPRLQQRLDLTSESKAPLLMPEIERFDPEMIPRQE